MNWKKLYKKTGYFFFASLRRKCLDALLEKHRELYRGVVLDIGGRDRGIFQSPKNMVEKWIITDIEESRLPDVVLDVCDMHTFKNESVDVINALEVFEHVGNPEKGLIECFRVLKKSGAFLVSMPFLYPVHADPNDFQRWTAAKWKSELQKIGFLVETLHPMGYFFTVLADMMKSLNTSLGHFKYFGFVFYPILHILVYLDQTKFVKNNPTLMSYTTGYFIICRK